MSKESKAYKNLPKKVYIRTFGCQMNVSDSGMMINVLKAAGFEESASVESADIVIFNSCSVRQHAEDRMFSNLGLAMKKNPSAGFVLAGCTAARCGGGIFDRFPRLGAVVGPSEIFKIASVAEQVIGGEKVTAVGEGDYPVVERAGGVSEYVVIQRGCDNFCSYCLVPRLRGKESCRPPSEILREINCLAESGTKEVILLGQNVNSYRGAGNIKDFPALLSAVSAVEGIKRIRFLTSHPKDLSDGLIEKMAENPTIAKHIHLPVQSGSTRILKLMNRNYTREDYLLRAAKLKKRIPSISITTDVIVGFPSETDDDFEETLSLIREVSFDGVFVFKYSPREGTAAEELPDDVGNDEKKRRLEKVLVLAKELSKKSRRSWVGADAEVLFEKDGVGHSSQNFLVLMEGARKGNLRKAAIKGTSKWCLIA